MVDRARGMMNPAAAVADVTAAGGSTTLAGRQMLMRIKRASIVAFLAYSGGIAMTYGAQLVIARAVGATTFGVYTYVYAWVVVLAYIAAFGFDVALLRFIPAYREQGDIGRLNGVVRYSQRWTLVAGLSIALAGLVVAVFAGWPTELRNAFAIGFSIVPLMALMRVRCAIIRGLGGVLSALVPDRVVRDFLVIAILANALLFGHRVEASWVMAATAIGVIASLSVTVPIIRRMHSSTAASNIMFDAPTWIRAVLPLMVIGAAEGLMNRTGVLALGWFGDTNGAGAYGLAFNIALVVTLPRIAVNTMFAPEIAALHARNDTRSIQLLVSRSASWTLIAGIAIAVVLYALAEPLFVWFGPGYESGVPALRILLVAQVIASGAGSQLYVMTMTGRERSAAALLLLSALGNGIASLILAHQFQTVGAALATAVAMVLWNFSMAVYLWREFGLRPGVLGAIRGE